MTKYKYTRGQELESAVPRSNFFVLFYIEKYINIFENRLMTHLRHLF